MIQIGLILALGTVIAAIIYILTSSSKQKGKEIVVPLQDLSRIWVSSKQRMGKGVNEEIGKKENEETEEKNKTEKSNSGLNHEVETGLEPVAKPDKPAIDTTFYEECIAPYAELLKTQNLDAIVKELLAILDKYKNTSSIVQKPYDEEAGDLHIILDAVKNVNIRDHTYSVTRIFIGFTKNTYISYEEIIPVTIIAGLAHDIGKIKELTGKEEGHPALSVEILTGIVNRVIEIASEDKQPNRSVIELASSAIKNHHVQTTDQLTTLLKKADQTARGYELMLRASDMKVMAFHTWFDAEKYVNNYIAPEINNAQGNTCQAFSFNGIVYVRTEYLHEAAGRMCADLKIIDTALLYESEKQNVIRKIVSALQDTGYIHDMLQSPRISMKFELVQRMGGPKKNILTLTPLKGDSFDLQSLEQKKTDFLIYIEDVKRVEK